MRRYETIIILHPELAEEELQSSVERYRDIAVQRGGVVVKMEKWGKRKLAYEINKQTRGVYVLMDYAGGSGVVNELERNLKIDDRILKYLTVRTAESVSMTEIEKEMKDAGAPEGAAVPEAAGKATAPQQAIPAAGEGTPASGGEPKGEPASVPTDVEKGGNT